MKTFIDNFSQNAVEYSKYRPIYPNSLYEYLSSVVNQKEVAWDCGTGNGQFAQKLSAYFRKVIATDPSEAQIKNAVKVKNVEYRVERAEQSSIENSTVDLITVAQAIHWFDIDKFIEEVDRVLAPNGVLAIWCYEHAKISSSVDKVVTNLANDILRDYWDERNRMTFNGYSQIDFPYTCLEAPSFVMNIDYTLNELFGLLKSWSATKKYENDKGESPIEIIREELIKAWGTKPARLASWDIALKVWQKSF